MNKKYFERSYQKAKQSFDRINDNTKEQRTNAMFALGGHMSKGYLNRSKRIVDKVCKAASRSCLRETFYLIAQLDINQMDDHFWTLLDTILVKCNLNKYLHDDYDFFHKSFPHIPVGTKLAAIKYFIETCGNKLDKKYLIPHIAL
jgi:hypothetical protein